MINKITMVDNPNGLDYNPYCDDFIGDVEMTTVSEDEINALAADLATMSIEAEIDDEYEALMDALYAEHEARMHAANSYDNDAIAYGEMI
jgi:adenine-specific DNA methylase